jgi:Protein of unknown function (DUF3379)
MISCAEYRRQMLAEPNNASPLLREHRKTCEACAAYSVKLERFEAKLRQALEVPIGAQQADNVVQLAARRRPVPPQRRWLAVAASVLGGIGIATFLWIGSVRPTLASAVVAHLGHEPGVWNPTDRMVPTPELAAVLKDAGVRLGSGLSRVSYAQSCLFRMHHVPHLVVQTASGPVTVMVLAYESVDQAQRFDEQGYQGMLVPVHGHGSLAVIMRGKTEADVQRVADLVMREVQWLP